MEDPTPGQMRVEILDEAQQDLLDGFRFYECQSEGLGDYFLDSQFSDIILSRSTPVSIPCISDIAGFSPSGSLSHSTTASPAGPFEFTRFSIVGGTLHRFGTGSHRPRGNSGDSVLAS